MRLGVRDFAHRNLLKTYAFRRRPCPLTRLRCAGRAAGWPRGWRPRLGRLKVLEVGDGFAGLGGCREDGAVVVLQQREPVRQILGMIGPRVLGDGELGDRSF